MARTKSDFRKSHSKPTKKGGKSTKEAAASSSKDACVRAEPRDPTIRLRPGMGALREIREYQSNTELLMPKIPFQRIIREIAMKIGSCRFEVQALLALQEAAEMFLVGLCEDASLCAGHGRRVTLMQRDIQLSRRLRLANPGSAKKAYKSEASNAKASSSTAKPEAPLKDEKTATGSPATPISEDSKATADTQAAPGTQSAAETLVDSSAGAAQVDSGVTAMDEDDDDEGDEDYDPDKDDASEDDVIAEDDDLEEETPLPDVPNSAGMGDIPVLKEL